MTRTKRKNIGSVDGAFRCNSGKYCTTSEAAAKRSN